MSTNDISSGIGEEPISDGVERTTERTETTTESAEPQQFGNVNAVVGPIAFKEGLNDPDVEVTNERETTDHEIVTGHDTYRSEGAEYVVQALGRRPTELQVTGWIAADQLEDADNIVSEDRINVVSARWTGIAVPEKVDVAYSRTYHDTHGWIFETTFELLGVARGQLLEDESVQSTSVGSIASDVN